MYATALLFLFLACSADGYRLHSREQAQSEPDNKYDMKQQVYASKHLRPSSHGAVDHVLKALAMFLLLFHNPASGCQAAWHSHKLVARSPRCKIDRLHHVDATAQLKEVLTLHAQPSLRRAEPPCALAFPTEYAPLAALGTLSAVVAIHEAGHFLAARVQGIRIAEFAVGIGPKLWGVEPEESGQPGFALRALPIGGFVSFPRATNRTELEEAGYLKPGESFPDEVPDTPDLLENRPALERASVIVAGIVANIVLAWGLLFASGISLGVEQAPEQQIVVTRVDPRSVADKVGFRAGDRVLQVGGNVVDPFDRQELDSVMKVWRSSITERKPFAVEVQRDSGRRQLSVPRLPESQRLIGVSFKQESSTPIRERLTPAQSAVHATDAVRQGVGTVANGLGGAVGSLLPGSKAEKVQLKGPVGIAEMGSKIASTDALQLLDFAALLSLNLAVINALPVPGLDGWLMTILLIETAMGRKLSKSTQGNIDDLTALIFVLATSRVLLSDLQGRIDFVALQEDVQLYGPSTLGALAVGIAAAEFVEYLENNGDNGTDVEGRRKRDELSRSRRSRENPKPRLNLRRADSQRSQKQREKRGNRKPGVDDRQGLLLRFDQRGLRSSQRQRDGTKSKNGNARGWWWQV